MKKSFLSIAMLLSFAIIYAIPVAHQPVENEFVSISANVNSFCKLIQLGDYDAVKALVAQGEDVNAKSTGLTPLMFAARHNQAEIAELLIDNGAKLNSRSEKGGMTALEMAEQYKATDAYDVIKEAADTKKKKHKK